MSTAVSRSLSRPLAILLSLLLALSGLTLLAPAAPARAAAGDVAGATLQWGVKQSFRSYIAGPIAHGSWTASGVTDATPFGWSGGAGTTNGTPSVGYPGSLRFTGHAGFGVPAGEYALDLSFSDLRLRITGSTTAELLLDARSRGFADPTAFVELNDVVFATLDLAGGTNASTAETVAYSGVPAVLTAAGVAAFGDFYGAGTALDPVSFSWPVEQAPEPEPVVPTVTVSETEGLHSGDVVTVTGTGFGPTADGGPRGTRPPLAGKFGGVYVTFGSFLDVWKPSEGAPTSARAADRSTTKWIVNPEDVATVGAASGGVAIGADGSFELEVVVTEDFVGALEDGNYGIYTYSGSGATYAPFETFTPIAFADDEEPAVPTVTVTPTTDLESGDVVTVTGTGFGPTADGGPRGTRPPLAGRFGGVYVTFGSFLDVWKPSEGAPSSARAADRTTTKWFVAAEDVATVGAAGGGVAIGEDGSFELEVVVTEDFVGALEDGNYGIYTYAGSGAVHAPFETSTPLTFGDAPEPVVPTVTVSETEDLESGDVVTVTGTGFGPTADGGPLGTRPPLAGRFGGVYVTFGTFLDVWKPSEGAPSSARAADRTTTKWLVNSEDVATVGAADGGVALGEDGSFELEIVVTEDFAGALADGNYGIYTYAGSGAVHAPFETYTPIAFAEEVPPVDPGPAPSAGSLSWGVKASFRDYVTGATARGTITVTGGAGLVGGTYWFPQAGEVSGSGDTASASYRGTVTFTGHSGVLNLRLSDPSVRLTGTGSAVLSLATASGRVDFATLDLRRATASTDATGARTFTGAPATLTAAGAASFEGFYSAGTALDPVTFTLGSANATSGGGGSTGAPAKGATRTPAATPPATTGITSGATSFVEGGEYTFSADGFLPGETGILAVVYSTPTVLADDLTADAAGTVAWTGVLPRGLTGAHTLTFQGSVDRGIELQIDPAETVGCLVESAQLLWGFKESFRAYIDGSIANGEWTTADGATYETPLFTWASGSGGYDAETGDADLSFPGSVRFTGHGGILDTTVANPRVVVDGDRATLFLDVSGTTQAGEPVAATGVEFATLDLAAGERTGGGDLVAFTGVPATLTAAGAAAFGTYPAGESLDPIELRITVGADCIEPVAAPEEASATGAEVEPVSQAAAWPWILLAVALAAIVALAVVLVVRSRRAA